MDIIISNSDKRPIYEQIRSQIKENIMSGRLEEGDSLPSMRSLAKDLKISVITSKRAYDELEKDGFIITVQGKGSFVAQKNKDLVFEESLKKIEENFSEAIKRASYLGLSKEELVEILELLYEEE